MGIGYLKQGLAIKATKGAFSPTTLSSLIDENRPKGARSKLKGNEVRGENTRVKMSAACRKGSHNTCSQLNCECECRHGIPPDTDIEIK